MSMMTDARVRLVHSALCVETQSPTDQPLPQIQFVKDCNGHTWVASPTAQTVYVLSTMTTDAIITSLGEALTAYLQHFAKRPALALAGGPR